ncbi:Flp family type IVb pilin [Pseudohoeflea coraliihabitans]|uniref:Flp family type IVb pilin n=1 Tax=Pseudohoeflea coraliihabitans TaxID=2860393 RepID=A0ABS6WKJ6_9HYPH|nr:Flp family type IVb pilin [Pseudohoeflea sp. DP4N28-3]MBW3096476.1 Flp family type IVb pilin [Pseudohoeflea sp. DP4N28-3]
MSVILRRLLRNSSGATAIEYGLIAALISISLVVGIGGFGNTLGNLFNKTSTTMTNAAD